MTPEIQSPRVTPLRAGLLCCLTLVLGLPWARAADSNPPERMTYQGYLTDANGAALGNPNPRNYDVLFRLWQDESSTSSGDLLWSEQQTVTVDNGYFSVLLGEGSQVGSEPRPALSTVFRGSTASVRWMGVTVKDIDGAGSTSDILPRLRLLSSPFAFLAAHAVQADRLVNGSSEQVVTIAGSNVGINQPSPAAPLDVNGDVRVRGDLYVDDAVTANRTYANHSYFATDGSYYAEVKSIGGGMNPVLAVDGNDWLQYDRANNAYTFFIASAWKMHINNNGVTVPSPGTLSGYGTIPIGGIIMWSGSAVPDGWALCDGSTVNSRTTPDLRNRFVVGADPNGVPGTDPPYEIGDIGGENFHALTASEMPSHSHSTTFAHNGYPDGSGDRTNDYYIMDKNRGADKSYATTSTGGNAAHENRPPFYALAFIMRVK